MNPQPTNAGEVERWRHCSGCMVKAPDGDYVLASDYDQLKAENEKLRKDVLELDGAWEEVGILRARIAELEGELKASDETSNGLVKEISILNAQLSQRTEDGERLADALTTLWEYFRGYSISGVVYNKVNPVIEALAARGASPIICPGCNQRQNEDGSCYTKDCPNRKPAQPASESSDDKPGFCLFSTCVPGRETCDKCGKDISDPRHNEENYTLDERSNELED